MLIDAGSTGTRIHVLRCAARLGLHPAAPPSIEMLWPHLHQAPGLSAYGNPADAAASLRPLLEFAYRAVPEALHARTPVHLLATAGLRLLPPEAATAILDACSAELASSRLLFRRQWAAIINGSTEGIYSFIAVNYARGALQGAVAASGAPSAGPAHNIKGLQPQGPQGPQLVGVLELGGASLQVTFLPEGPQHPSGSSGGEQQAEGLRELQAELELLGEEESRPRLLAASAHPPAPLADPFHPPSRARCDLLTTCTANCKASKLVMAMAMVTGLMQQFACLPHYPAALRCPLLRRHSRAAVQPQLLGYWPGHRAGGSSPAAAAGGAGCRAQ